jgi:hypothetical protein
MYQIGNSFTRLQSSIDFSEVQNLSVVDAACVLGVPPPQFSSVHCPALVNAWHERLQAALEQPVQVELRRGHRRVQILGDAIFDINATGVVCVYGWVFNERDVQELDEIPSNSVVAKGVPYQGFWMTGWRESAFRTLLSINPGKVALCQGYLARVNAQLLELCWTALVQEQVRTSLAQALDLDGELLTIAQSIQRCTQPRIPVRVEDYNHVVACKQQYKTLAREAPQLICLYAMVFDSIEDGVEVTQGIKQLLTSRGISPAMWRLLTRAGTQWMHEFLPYFAPGDQGHVSTHIAFELLKIVQAFGTSELPPTYLIHALLKSGGNPNDPHTYYVERIKDLFALCKRVGHFAETADSTTTLLLQEHADAIFNWACDHIKSVPQATLRRVGLKWLIRAVHAQALLEEKRFSSAQAWEVPHNIVLKRAEFSAVILNSPLAVWQESQTMRHCADKYIDRCARGEMLIVSLRDRQHRHPLATVSFEITASTVSIHKYSGFANQKIDPKVEELIRECRSQLQSQRRALAAEQTDMRLARVNWPAAAQCCASALVQEI